MNRKQRRTAASTGRSGGDSAQAQQSYLTAYAHHAQGDLESAKAHYLRAVAKAPNHAGVLLGLGLIALKHHVLDEAEDLLRRAAELEPNDANILSNVAAVLWARSKFPECIDYCHKALAIDPDNAEALLNLSNSKRALGDIDEAISIAERVIVIAPNRAKGYATLAASLILRPDPSHEKTDRAIELLKRSNSLDPDDSTGDLVLVGLLLQRGRPADAVEFLNGSRLDTSLAEYNDLAQRAYFELQDYATSLKYAQQRCAAEPDSAGAHEQLAKVLGNLSRHEEALKELEKTVELDPNEHKARLDMCQIRQALCMWDGLEELQRDVVEIMAETKSYAGPFHLISMPEPIGSPENQLMTAQIYATQANLIGSSSYVRHTRSHTNPKLKIGYLSNDYRDHATAFLIAELIERHDRSKFEIAAYCYSQTDGSAFQRRLRNAFDRFVDINALSVEGSAKRIEDDRVDILIDLKGYTQGSRSRILTHRPAPIQVNYLGFPGTLGFENADYIIGDEFLTPLESAAYYSEKIVQLPNCYQPNDTQRALDGYLLRREDFGIPRDAFVFCSFNNPNKLTRSVFQIWMRLLDKVPGSVLWQYMVSETAKTNIRKEAIACGIDPDRIIFAPYAPVDTHIARMRLGDLFLDSFPCTAHTTASEALWAGLPILTCAGRTFASRVAGSILRAAGLPDLVTESLEDYEAMALKLAQSPALLAQLKERASRAKTSPLFDIDTYTRDLETAYLQMAEHYNAGKNPEAISVRDLKRSTIDDPKIQETTVVKSMDWATTLSPQPSSAAIAPAVDARIAYQACPLCHSNDRSSLGDSICSGHQLYKPSLPPTIEWNLCHDCRHVFASGFFGEEALVTLYPKTPIAERAGHDVERKRPLAAKVVQRVAKVAKAGIWLDVGFGDGSLLFAAEEWGYRPVGLDLRADNVAAMQELDFEAHEQCIEMYEPSEPCSVVSMVNLLQHVPFPGSAIEHASRLLKPGGVLFLTMPNMDSMAWRMLDKERVNAYWTDIEIYHHFTRKRIYALLLENGLVPFEYNVSERYRASMEVMAIKPATAPMQAN